jgi:hypothetical protein
MKRIILSSTFLFACLLGACSSEKDVICEVTWSDQADNELGMATITYEALDDVDLGLEMCETDQETLDERPVDTANYYCNCRT